MAYERKTTKKSNKDSIMTPAMIFTEINNFYQRTIKQHLNDMTIYIEKYKKYQQFLKENEKDNRKIGALLNPPIRPVFILYNRVQEVMRILKPSLANEFKKKITITKRNSVKVSLVRRLSKY